MSNPTDQPPPTRPARGLGGRFAAVRAAGRAAERLGTAAWRALAPFLWLLALCGLLLVAGDRDRPWLGPPERPAGPVAGGGLMTAWKAPLAASLEFPAGVTLGPALRQGGLRLILAGPRRVFEREPQSDDFTSPYPRRAWDPGWGVASSSYANVGAPGVAQHVLYLRIGGLFLVAFVAAFAALWFVVAFALKIRRQRRGEPDPADRRPGRFDLLRGVVRPWVLLAATAGLAELTGPVAALAGYGPGANLTVLAMIAPAGIGDELPPAARVNGLWALVNRTTDRGEPMDGVRSIGSGGWRIEATWGRWQFSTFAPVGTATMREGVTLFVGPWWGVTAGVLGSLAAVRRWRRDRAELPAFALPGSS